MKKIEPLRPLSAETINEDGEQAVLLSDPSSWSEKGMRLSMPAFAIVTLIDGQKNLDEIIKACDENFGFLPDEKDVSAIIDQLDKALFLENDRFAEAKRNERLTYEDSPTRKTKFAGQSYPSNAMELTTELKSFLKIADRSNGDIPKAVVVPHIDYQVGAQMMADGWAQIKESDAELFIILGTGHTLSDDFFAITDKDYETPVGTMPVDKKFMELFGQNFGEPVLENGYVHANEHSIEFASIFYAHLFGEDSNKKVVPILLSYPEMIWESDHPVFGKNRIEKFLKALHDTISEYGKKTVFVASVDFSHVGGRFGDDTPLGEERLEQIRAYDLALINSLEKIDEESFLSVIKDGNEANRVCGYPALHALLKICPADKGELLGYKQNIEGENSAVVSFATMTIF